MTDLSTISIPKKNVAVIGGGPAGLRAAEIAASGGAQVTVYDAMPSVGRKFLVAGKSGLNLTNDESLPEFLEKYSGTGFPSKLWRAILSNFDNSALREWANGLGIETFAASSGKVFPSPINGKIKAAPLLRRWVERLRSLGVAFEMNHRWTGFSSDKQLTFENRQSSFTRSFDAVVLALGGASWPQTGSDGNWVSILAEHGIGITPLTSANCGWEADWPPELIVEAEGSPIKNILLKAGEKSRRGELMITRYGLEGGPVYRLGPAIRSLPSPHVTIDFKPDFSVEELVDRMGAVKRNFVREARRRWKLDPASCVLLKFLPNRGPWRTTEQLAREVKNCHVPLTRPRPIAEAISSAGGIAWNELDESLMLRKIPGVFIAGEMIDWEAPTGGYLLQACFATGNHAGNAALSW